MAPNPPKRIEASHFSADTLEFIRLLQEHAVRYLIVGGEAVIYHGYARFTGDVDFFYALDGDNPERLFKALQEFWSGNIPSVDSADDLKQAGYIIQFGRPPNRIDLLSSVDGVEFEEAWNGREIVGIEGTPVPLSSSFLSLEMLMRNKRASGRPKDLDDLAFLEKARPS